MYILKSQIIRESRLIFATPPKVLSEINAQIVRFSISLVNCDSQIKFANPKITLCCIVIPSLFQSPYPYIAAHHPPEPHSPYAPAYNPHPVHGLKVYKPYQYDISKIPECAYANKHYYNLTFCLQDDYYPV